MTLQDTNEKGLEKDLQGVLTAIASEITQLHQLKMGRKINRSSSCAKRPSVSCLESVESNFVYHMNNTCYESYTPHKTLQSAQKSDELDNQTIQCGGEYGKM